MQFYVLSVFKLHLMLDENGKGLPGSHNCKDCIEQLNTRDYNEIWSLVEWHYRLYQIFKSCGDWTCIVPDVTYWTRYIIEVGDIASLVNMVVI